MRYFVLLKAGSKIESGDFFYSSKGVFERFEHAVRTAMNLWKMDERTMREYAQNCFFLIAEHRLLKGVPKLSDDNRCQPVRCWYWNPMEDDFFYPYEYKSD